LKARRARCIASPGAVPLGHVGMFGDLAVNCPGGAVIVRRRLAGGGIDVGQHDKAELWVLVERVPAGWGGQDKRREEIAVPEAPGRPCGPSCASVASARDAPS